MEEPFATTTSPAFPLAWRSQLLDGSMTVLVAVEGELDRHTAPALRDHLEWWLAGSCRRLVLDTGSVTSADVGAYDLLRTLGLRAATQRCRVVLASVGAPLRHLLDLLGTPDGVVVEKW